LGCETKPEDRWPVITTWSVTADLTVSASIDTTSGLITVTPPDSKVKIHTVIRTFNANQQFTAKVVLQNVVKDYSNIYPDGTVISETSVLTLSSLATWDGIVGTYVAGSGQPPQGEVTIDLFVVPSFIPLSINDWYVKTPTFTELTTLYTYNFLVIMEDMGGRTDTFDFTVYSTLSI
jgi:hypothetical protein